MAYNTYIRIIWILWICLCNDKMRLKKLSGYGLKFTKEVKSEVADMCTYATAMENKGMEKGLKALVQSLKEYIPDFDSLYKAVIRNEDYRNATREEVMKYYR